jgi:hypothetical protein
MSGIVGRLKPTDREILDLARRESDSRAAAEFEPICRGPLFALLAIPVIALAAAPACAWRLLRGGFAPRDEDAA